MAFALPSKARHSLVPLAGATVTTLVRLHIMLRTGQSLAPSKGLRYSASTTRSLPPPGAVLPPTLASRWTGLTPAGCHELVARSNHHNLLILMAPEQSGRTMEPVAALEMWGGAVFVLRMDLME